MSLRIRAITYQVSFVIRSKNIIEAELVRDVLIGLGVKAESIIETDKSDATILSVYYTSQPQAKLLFSAFKKLRVKNVAVRVQALEKNEWLTKWKEDFKPFSLTKSFGVVPSWLKNQYTFKTKQTIFIDTHLAFGTGLHPTTKYVSSFIDRCRGKFQSFCDVGTGTGILSIVASFCGAQDILGIDISDDCIQCARNNFLLNHLDRGKFQVADISTWKTSRSFDFVAANLITHDLIKYQKKILALVKPQKYLAVSGISSHNYQFFKEAFSRLSLRCLKVEKKEGWVALLYKRL